MSRGLGKKQKPISWIYWLGQKTFLYKDKKGNIYMNSFGKRAYLDDFWMYV